MDWLYHSSNGGVVSSFLYICSKLTIHNDLVLLILGQLLSVESELERWIQM